MSVHGKLRISLTTENVVPVSLLSKKLRGTLFKRLRDNLKTESKQIKFCKHGEILSFMLHFSKALCQIKSEQN